MKSKKDWLFNIFLELERTLVPIVPVKGDILILGGDIGDLNDDRMEKFITTMSKDFKDVILITGNREYYQWKKHGQLGMLEIDKEIEKMCNKLPNVHFLNKKTWIHPC